MLTNAKPLLTSSWATKRVMLACAAKQESLHFLCRLTTRENQSASGKQLEDISPPYLLNQLKYSSDSYLQRDFHDDDMFERYSQMIPRNITKDAASMAAANQDEVAYDEDYDQFYSHMTPSSMQNQDREQLDSLEMIQHDDVEPSEGLRINNAADDNLLEQTVAHASCYSAGLEDDDYVELEEDWEIMHQSLNRNGEMCAPLDIYDNIDDVNDVVQ